MDEETKTVMRPAARSAAVFGTAFIVLSAALKYGSQYGEGYTVTASYPVIVAGGLSIFLAVFLVKTVYGLYHSPPAHRQYSTE